MEKKRGAMADERVGYVCKEVGLIERAPDNILKRKRGAFIGGMSFWYLQNGGSNLSYLRAGLSYPSV